VAASLEQRTVKVGPDVPSDQFVAPDSQNQGGKQSLVEEVLDPKARDLGGNQSLVEEGFYAHVHATSACSGDSSPPGDKTVDLQGLQLEDGEFSCSQAVQEVGSVQVSDKAEEDNFFDSIDNSDPVALEGFGGAVEKDFFTVSLSTADQDLRLMASNMQGRSAFVHSDGRGACSPDRSSLFGQADSERSPRGSVSSHDEVDLPLPPPQAPAAGSDAAMLAKLKVFCNNVIKTQAPPLLMEVESSRLLGQDVDLVTPRRLMRSSASVSRPSKPLKRASVAENVLLKALGITPADLEVSEQASLDFKDMFNSPLQDQHIKVIAAIFGKEVPSVDRIIQEGISAH
jgi:hypothetical protein